MDQLNIVQWNAQSINSNKHAFSYFLHEYNIHVALLCETWLKPHMRFSIKGYNIVRLDSGNTHNGVAILIHNSLQFSKIDTLNDDSIQNIAIRLKYGNNKEISLVSFYSPGNASFTKYKFDNLIRNIPGPLLVGGDFNAHHSAWGCNSVNIRGREVLEIINGYNLVLLNDGEMTTVGSDRWQRNALDLTVVSASISLSCNWSVHDDPLGSYHLPVITRVLINNNYNISHDTETSNLPKHFNFNLVDWEIYTKSVDSLLIDFKINQDNPLQSYNDLIELLNLAISKSLPSTLRPASSFDTTLVNNNRKKRIPLPWWNLNCTKAVEDSRNAYKEFKYNPTLEKYIEFKKLQAFKKLVLKRERYLSWISLCESFNRTTPLSRVWQISKRFNKTFTPPSNNISPWVFDFLKKYTPDSVEGPFQSIPHVVKASGCYEYLINPFSLQELKSAISSRRDSAFGLDGIPYKMLKNVSIKALSDILSVYNLLWQEMIIPNEWKTDCLIPVLKPNKVRHKAESYRPVALTSCMGKTFEQLIKQRLEFYIESNSLLPSNQFGFRRGCSTRDSISHLQLDIYNSYKMDNYFVGVFFDVVGAFNNINLHILCGELRALGIPEKVIKWIFNFLHGREVYVKVNKRLIGPRFSYKGVCQGGILSPLIYLLYLHRLNIVLGLEVANLQFADDLVIYASGSDISSVESILNTALTQLKNYFHYLNLDISPEKSKVIVFGECETDLHIYYNNSVLPIVNEVKFLGIIFTSNLSWTKYVDYLLGRANKAFNFVKSLSIAADPKILLMLYKSLVRSHFEYGFLCFGSDQRFVHKLEILQNHNLRCVTGAMKTTPINSLQIECNTPPINIRFQFLKSKYILKLLSFENHPLLKKILFYHRVYNPSDSVNVPYIFHDFSNLISIDDQYQIEKCKGRWPCYSGNYISKFWPMDIYINRNLRSKEDVYQLIAEFPGYRHIFTDGSKNNRNVSLAIYLPHLTVGHGVRLPGAMTIFTAESLAILTALQYINEKNLGHTTWLIATDCMSALMALQNPKLDANIGNILYEIRTLYADLCSRGFTISLIWTPSHIGVAGNENADYLARVIVDMDNIDIPEKRNVAIPSSDLLTKLHEQNICIWLENWQETLGTKGKWYAKINQTIGSVPWFTRSVLHKSRKFYTTINRLRLGHGRFNAHLARMKIITSPVCTNCDLGTDQTLDHIIFECPAYALQRIPLIDKLLEIYKTPASIPRDTQGLLENYSTYIALYKFIDSTGWAI